MRCVLSLTTIPSRIGYIRPTLESLVSQDYTPDEIYLWVPRSFRRVGGTPDLPEFLGDLPIRVHHTKDVGPLTKLAPTLMIERDPHTFVITADDDMRYPSWWLSSLLKLWDQNRCAVGSRGRVFKEGPRKYKNTRVVGGRKGIGIPPADVDIITGVEGALYQVGFFNNALFDPSPCPSSFYNDDVWIAGHLSRNGVPRMVSGIKGIGVLGHHKEDSLRKINRRKGFEDEIIEFFPTLGTALDGHLRKRGRVVRRNCSLVGPE